MPLRAPALYLARPASGGLGLLAAVCVLPLRGLAQTDTGELERHRYQLVSTLSADGTGYQTGNAQGGEFYSTGLQEGGEAVLTGHIWRPKFVLFDLRGEARALHQLSSLGLNHGYRLGAGAQATLFPYGVIPLTLTYQRYGNGPAFGSVPGQSLNADVLSLDWQLVIPDYPRLWLSLRSNSQEVSQQGLLPTELSGAARGQEREGSNRSARLAVSHDTEKLNLMASYLLELLSDKVIIPEAARDQGAEGNSTPEALRLRQSFDMDSHSVLGELVYWDIYADGNVFNSWQGDRQADTQAFRLSNSARVAPGKRLSGQIMHVYANGSRGAGSSNGISSSLLWLYRDGLSFGAFGSVDHALFPEGATYDTLSSELLGGQAAYSYQLGALSGDVSESLGLGAAQAEPGSSGLRLDQMLASDARLNLPLGQLLSLYASAHSARNGSSAGGERDATLLQLRWTSYFLRLRGDVFATAANTVSQNGRIDARQERLRDARLEATLDVPFGNALQASGGAGARASDSSSADDSASSFYASLVVGWRPLRDLQIRTEGLYMISSYAGQDRHLFRTSAIVGWAFRDLTLDAYYHFSYEDQQGVAMATHNVFFTLSRRFQLAF